GGPGAAWCPARRAPGRQASAPRPSPGAAPAPGGPDRSGRVPSVPTLPRGPGGSSRIGTAPRGRAAAAPFLSDWIHRALVGGSVHLAPFPTDLGRRAPELLQAMAAVRTLACPARAARGTTPRPVR